MSDAGRIQQLVLDMKEHKYCRTEVTVTESCYQRKPPLQSKIEHMTVVQNKLKLLMYHHGKGRYTFEASTEKSVSDRYSEGPGFESQLDPDFLPMICLN